MSRRIVTLNSGPVSIEHTEWPFLTQAAARDGTYPSQTSWFLGVRLHGSGQMIVQAAYHYADEGIRLRRGELLEPGAEVVEAIIRVAQDIQARKHHGDDAGRWDELLAACIADLPALEL